MKGESGHTRRRERKEYAVGNGFVFRLTSKGLGFLHHTQRLSKILWWRMMRNLHMDISVSNRNVDYTANNALKTTLMTS